MGLSPSDAALAFYRIPNKRIAYTFGSDEINQTVTTFNPTAQAVLTTEVHTFGHDGHGSVRVLFDAGSKLAQAYTYAAYGELLAIHNGLGASLGNAASAALTSMLYNGESFDGRIGQLYLRARWYDGHRFTTIDPYAGDASNPMSFNKFGFVHADPIQGVDPTGMFFSVGGMFAGSYIGSTLNGINGEAGQLVAESFHRQSIAWDFIAYSIAGAAFGMASKMGGEFLENIVNKLGPHAEEAFERMWYLRKVFEVVGSLPNDLVLQSRLLPIVQRGILRVAMFGKYGYGIFGKVAHHLVPLEVRKVFPELMERAARGGFNINGLENGMLLRATGKYSDELFEEGFRHFGNHPKYNALVIEQIRELSRSAHLLSDLEIANKLHEIASELAKRIGNGTLKVN